MDIGKLQPDALRDHPLLAASGDKKQIFLTIVIKTEIVGGLPGGRQRKRRRDGQGAIGDRLWLADDEGTDALDRFGLDAGTEAKPGNELAVVDCKPSKGRLGNAGIPAVFGDITQ